MRLIAALPLLLTGLIVGCATTEGGDDAHPQVQVEPAADGWRWESYGGIELQVPDSYEWNTSGSPSYPAWCAATGRDGAPLAAVNRVQNQVMPAIGCPPRPPSTFAPSVDLASYAPVGVVRLDDGWVSETVEVAGVKVTVSDDDAARRARILRSIRPIGETDAHGCPPSSDLAQSDARPSTTPPASDDDVAAVAVCRYALPTQGWADRPPKPLVSSSRISGAEATDLVRAVLAAPEGEGPNSPESCAPQVSRGDEALVLRINSSRGRHEVVVRYSGCDGHGTDDGTTTRALTSDVLNAVLTGPNQPSTLQGDVAALLDR